MQANEETKNVGKKPEILSVTCNGKRRLVGVSAAAKWLGCTSQALGQIIRGDPFFASKDAPLPRRVKEAYPELF